MGATHSCDEKMANKTFEDNDVNGSLFCVQEGSSSGSCSVSMQADTGRHQATAQRNTTRRKWGRAENRIVMECYFKSQPNVEGYRKRMLDVWNCVGPFQTTEQRLADQVRQIKLKGWFSDIELDEIKRNLQRNDTSDTSQTEVEINEHTPGHDESIGSYSPNEWSTTFSETFLEPEKEIANRIITIMDSNEWDRISMTRNMNKKQVMTEVNKINQILGKIITNDITATNRLIYAGAVVVTELLGLKRKKRGNPKGEPKWKRRLELQLKDLRRDASRIQLIWKGKNVKDCHRMYLEKKYGVSEKGLRYVLEDLKQRIKAKSTKIQRYVNRNKQFMQNRLFETDQRKFYKDIDGGRIELDESPDPEETRTFWGDLWEQDTEHRRDTEWLQKLREEIKITSQRNITVTEEMIKNYLKKVPNWKAPGHDFIQGFWVKNFTKLHQRIAIQLNQCVNEGCVPHWMTKGRTTLIMKDPEKGTVPCNYRPITCLPLMWKTLTGIISHQIYGFLETEGLLPEEQKGCKRGSQGTKDQLFIDKMTLEESKKRKKDLAMCWVDFQKAYDMVPHSWIIECLQLFGIAENVQNFLTNTMKTWRTELTVKGTVLGEVKIKRGIFQGDSLSPLLFVIAMIPLTLALRKSPLGYTYTNKTKINHLLYMDDIKLYAKNKDQLDSLTQSVRILSSDIGMKFGIEKCAVLVLKRGKVVHCEGIDLPNDQKIRAIKDDGYKYLGVLEADNVMHDEMKRKITKEYMRRVRKVAKSKLNGGNMIRAINTWAVALLRYAGGIVNWKKQDLKEIDAKTRKTLTMHGGFHPRDSVARLYVKRNEGGRGLISAEDCITQAHLTLQNYIHSSQEKLITAVRGDKPDDLEIPKNFKTRKKNDNLKQWKDKPLHGQFARQNEDQVNTKTWLWLKKGKLKKETESLITAAQDQAIRTNYIKTRIDKSQSNSKCRMCHSADETVSHIVSGCQKLAQKQYKRRHDNVAKAIHWDILGRCGFDRKQKWYEHMPECQVENDKFKILWDFSIRTDNEIQARRPDLVVIDKEAMTCKIIDVAIPEDTGVQAKEDEKVQKYQDLAREIRKMWGMRGNTCGDGCIGNCAKAT